MTSFREIDREREVVWRERSLRERGRFEREVVSRERSFREREVVSRERERERGRFERERERERRYIEIDKDARDQKEVASEIASKERHVD